MASPTVTRRRNVLALFQAFAEDALASGAAPKGMEAAFATRLEISPSMWSQIKSARPIGDKLARQIEVHCGKPTGWLDEAKRAAPPDAGEAEVVKLALAAWRASNAPARRAMRACLKRILAEGEKKTS